MANEPRNLYDLEDYFRVLIGGVWKYVDEPVGWDKVTIKLVRDKDWYGLNYEFVEGDTVTLLFAWGTGGGELLRDVYGSDGSDAEIAFEYGYYQNGTPKRQFAGVINFNDYEVQEDGIDVSIQKTFFQSLLRTRYETKVDMTASKSLDDAAITPPAPITLKLHSKRIKKYGRGEVNEPPAVLDPFFFTSAKNFYIQPDTLNITKQEVEDFFAMPLAVSNASPQSELRFQFQPKEAGRLNLHWEKSYRVHIETAGAVKSVIGNYVFQPVIQQYRGGTLLQTMSNPAAVKTGNAFYILDFTHTFSIDAITDAQIGDQFYFTIIVGLQFNSTRLVALLDVTGFIEVLQETVAPSSKVNAHKILDCFKQVVASITGSEGHVVSSFFGPGGCGEKVAITNGFQIRQFDISNKPVQISLKDLLEGSGPIWNAAVQYSIIDNTEKMRVEPVDAFFGGDRIWEFKEISGYTESHSKDMTWNEIEIGYQKFSEDELNTLDEFNTYQQWLLPIKSYKGKYQKKSGFIASGYEVEKMRREQFKDNPSTSLSNDDALFVICYITERKHKGVAFSIAGNKLTVSKQVNILAGETVKINKVGGGPNTGIVYTVLGAQTKPGEDQYFLSPAPVADTGIAEIEIPITGPEAEKNEAFDVVDNLISPDTAYNLRISPVRMLYNHSTILNSCLEKKADTAQIKNTYMKGNGQLKTKFTEVASCKLIDGNPAVKETDVIPLQAYNSRRKIWKPETVNFKAPIFYDDYIYIKERATGSSATSQDFGTIVWEDDLGVKWEGYIWSAEYDPEYEEITIQARKKRQI